MRQGCLHFFTISRSLASRRNQPKKYICTLFDQRIFLFSFPFSFFFSLTDKDHPPATTCKPIYHDKPVIRYFCSHSGSNKMIWQALQKRCTRWRGGNKFIFFMSVDFLIHSDQYANTWSMAVLIRRVTFLETKKSFKLRNLPSRTSTLFCSRRSACPFLNYDQVSKVLKKLSGTFYTLCSRKVRYWKESYLFINVS